MKGRLLYTFLIGLLQLNVVQGFSPDSAKIDFYLLRKMGENPNSYIKVYVYLEDQVDIAGLEQNFQKQHSPNAVRGREVVTRLKAKAVATQPPILSWLKTRGDLLPGSLRPLWIANVIFFSARASLISEITHRQDVAWVGFDTPTAPDDTYGEQSAAISPDGHEPGLSAIHAPALWAMGYTGYGRSALSIDTGVDHTHPALAQRFRGNYVPINQAWFEDSTGNNYPFVCLNDFGVRQDHGTHTTGIMVGLDPDAKDTIGVAPEGLWMGAASICDVYSSDNLAAFQWALDPDGDPATTSDMPDVINNSWRTVDVGDACKHLAYKQSLLALEAAGIAVVFSAGNEGPAAGSIAPPKGINVSLVNTFAVGAVNSNLPELPIQGFSSRGPSPCPGQGSLAIKPEVVAPGFQVRSSVLNGKYGIKSGTSMSAPHASGAILLLKEAFPYLTGEAIKLALYFTATDLGATGEDNAYGMGMIDVLAAYNYLIAEGHIPVIPSKENDVAIVEIENLPAVNCESRISPIVHWKNVGENAVNSVILEYTFSDGTSGAIMLTDSLAEDSGSFAILPQQTFSPGVYTLDILLRNPNGENDYRYLDNHKTVLFSIAPPLPQVVGDTVCELSEGMLTAISAFQGANIRWYDDSVGGNWVGEGTSFITPSIDTTTTYFAAAEWPLDTDLQCARVPVIATVVPGQMTAVFAVGSGKLVWPDSSEAEFTDVSVGSIAWRWDFGDGGFSEIPNPFHTYTAVGAYRVIFSAKGSDGCADAFADTVVVGERSVSTPIERLSGQFFQSIKIYPNPTSGIVYIHSFFTQPQNIALRIFDLQGKEILATNRQAKEGEVLTVDLTGFLPGIYLLTCQTSEGTISRKLIITP
ncbi:MAG: S8 family serine peptidase [Bacteroidia bacterium]